MARTHTRAGLDTCLETTPAMPHAVRLYQKHGYHQYDTVRYVDTAISTIDTFIQQYILYNQDMYFYRKKIVAH